MKITENQVKPIKYLVILEEEVKKPDLLALMDRPTRVKRVGVALHSTLQACNRRSRVAHRNPEWGCCSNRTRL
jgi:hypothetical protein